MNRLCEMVRPPSDKSVLQDDSGSYQAQSPAPGRREDLSKHLTFCHSSWNYWKRSGDGWVAGSAVSCPGSRPCLQNTHLQQVCVSAGTSFCLCASVSCIPEG